MQPTSTPTAPIWSERERLLTIDQLNDFSRLHPTHLVKTVAGWDHFPMIEQSQQFSEVISDLANQIRHYPGRLAPTHLTNES